MPSNVYQTRCMYSPSIDATIREVLHTLGDIDFSAEVELENVQTRTLDPKLKEHIKSKMRAMHRQKRQPCLELVATLRQPQHRHSFVA
ncbi:hypothetical protein [Microvirga yunnanensis]|uniref:hypothetical protein n=1 Tax=Microvirga yunnanensis TaxID=2953740 RepID=UPI0021C74730|nr:MULTISPECIES: hypothetical protein [unclassified Microvirga]